MSGSPQRIDLRPEHWRIVREILQRYIPERKVLAFGSRATCTAKEYSDLDLAILGDQPLSLNTTSALTEGFGDSDLPFKVDVVDWASIDEPFREIVRRDGIHMMTVVVISSNGKVIQEYPINIGSINDNVTEKEYFDEAWRAAIEDGIVDPDKRKDYEFSIR